MGFAPADERTRSFTLLHPVGNNELRIGVPDDDSLREVGHDAFLKRMRERLPQDIGASVQVGVDDGAVL